MYPNAKDNHQWEKELTSKVNSYKAFFIEIYPKWREWRRGEVRVSSWRSKNGMIIPPFFNYTAHGETKDDMTEEVVSYEDDMNPSRITSSRCKIALKIESGAPEDR